VQKLLKSQQKCKKNTAIHGNC